MKRRCEVCQYFEPNGTTFIEGYGPADSDTGTCSCKHSKWYDTETEWDDTCECWKEDEG